MDDNDPPSSPPIPRPYPLLTEIKSRSRVSSSLDSWEFSSPPGSPDPIDQEAIPDIQLPGEKPTRRRSEKAGTKAKNFGTGSKDVIPSSLGEGELSSSDLTELSDRNVSSSPDPPLFPETPTKKRLIRDAARVEDSPKSGDDEFVDARSSPEKPSFPQANDTSFALSEGDETRMLKLVDELESGDRAGLQEETKAEDNSDERPSVQPEELRAPSPPMTRRAAKRTPSAIIPPTPARPLGDGEGGSKRKRKRSGSRPSDNRSKKQRSESAEAVKELETPVVSEKEKEPASTGVETRGGSARRQRQQRQRKDKAEVSQKRSSKRNKKRRGGETDDEVMSQLVEESHAAVESQEVNGNAEDEVPRTNDQPQQSLTHMDVDVTVADEAGGESRAVDEKQTKALTIMETLQNSLEQLRHVALPRNEVYKMEDMLMDLKRELFEAERRGREGT
jgi:hypothetical protein